MILILSIALNICFLSFVCLLFKHLFYMSHDFLKILEINKQLLKRHDVILKRCSILADMLILTYNKGAKRGSEQK